MIPAISLSAVLAARAPLVGTFHTYAPRPRWYQVFAPLCRRALARLDARIAVSEAARWHVSRTCPGRYAVIPNGIDLPARAAVNAGRAGDRRILFIGRPERRKGLPLLLEAFGRLRTRATLDLVGPSASDVARSGAALPPSARERIHAHGRVDNETRETLLAAASILCAPALEGESFGVVLAEAMAAGVPVVASAIPGYREVVEPDCGRLVPPGDAIALACALDDLLADAGLRARMGAAGRIVAVRYSWTVVSDRVVAVYRRVLAERSDRRLRLPLMTEELDAIERAGAASLVVRRTEGRERLWQPRS